MHNFKFENEGVRVWQAYDTGEGKLVPWEGIQMNTRRTELVVKVDWDNNSFLSLDSEVMDSSPEPATKRKRTSISTTFDCTNDGCIRSFKTSSALEQHLLLGKCPYHPEKSLHSVTDEINVQSRTMFGDETYLRMGWATKQKRKRTSFSEKQTAFIKDHFKIGKVTGRKADPFIAAQEMRSLKNDDDSSTFSKSEYLTGQQIASYFSRLALKDRKAELEDFKSAEEETKLSVLKAEIMDTVGADVEI